jgi:hypothetical protein
MAAPSTERMLATPSATATATLATLEELVARPAVRRRRLTAQRAHCLTARVILAALGLQIFFAGAALFQVSLFGTVGFTLHALFAPVVILGSLSLPLIAWRGHLDRGTVRRSWLLFSLMLVQGLLIDMSRYVLPLFGAFHPLNAMLLVLVSYSLTRRRPA